MNQILVYEVCLKQIKAHEDLIKATLKGAIKEAKPLKGKLLFKPGNLKAERKDLDRIKKLPNIDRDIEKAASGKTYRVKSKNESYDLESSRILPFEKFSLNITR